MFVEIANLYLATLCHTLDDSAEKDVDNSGDVLTLGVKFFRPATTKDQCWVIPDILVRIRIHGSVPLTNESRAVSSSGSNSRSDSFLQ